MSLSKLEAAASKSSNGTVNLDKIRELRKSKNAAERALKSAQTKKIKSDICDIFQIVFKEVIGGKFTFRKTRWWTQKFPSGKTKRRRVEGDRDAIWNAYSLIKQRYDIDDKGIFRQYIAYAITLALSEGLDTTSRIFGFVVSEKVIDGFYLREKKRMAQTFKNQNIVDMKQRHAELFSDED